MKTMESTMKKVESSAIHGLQRVPGVSMVLDRLGLKPPSEIESIVPNDIGKVVLVGDFSFERNDKKRNHIARRVVKTLRNNNVIDRTSSADIRLMAPEVAHEESGYMNRAVDALAHALDKETIQGTDHYMHIEPIDLPVVDNSDFRAQAGSRISDIASGRSDEVLGDVQILVANGGILSDLFPDLRDYNMHRGGVAVLEHRGQSMEAIQLWPVAPLPSVDKVA